LTYQIIGAAILRQGDRVTSPTSVSLGIEYVVLQRPPHDGLHPRTTTALPSSCAAIQYNNESVGFSEFVGLEFRIR